MNLYKVSNLILNFGNISLELILNLSYAKVLRLKAIKNVFPKGKSQLQKKI